MLSARARRPASPRSHEPPSRKPHLTKFSAELAYLFRHVIVRDAAYELQPLTERGALHMLALGVIEDQCGGEPTATRRGWNTYLTPHATDPAARELADHAEAARSAGVPEAIPKSALYLKRAAWIEDTAYRTHDAVRLYQQLATHPGCNRQDRLWAHVGAAQMLYRLGEIAKAAAEYEAAEQLVDDSTDPAGRTVLRTGRAIVDSHSDNSERIALVHKQAAEFWREHGHVSGEVQALVNYAVWHCEFGSEAEGEQALSRAVELSRKGNNPRIEGAALGNLATLWAKQKQFAKAEQAMRRAIELARNSQNPITEVTWTLGLANQLRSLGRREECETTFRDAIRIATAAGLTARVDFGECQLAILYVEGGRAGEARPLWQRAWPRVQARGDQYTTEGVRRAMQAVLTEQGLSEAEWFA